MFRCVLETRPQYIVPEYILLYLRTAWAELIVPTEIVSRIIRASSVHAYVYVGVYRFYCVVCVCVEMCMDV